MNFKEVLNEFLEGRQLELDDAKFKKVLLLNRPVMMVYNDERRFIVSESIKNYSRFKKWDNCYGTETVIQPLIGRYVPFEKKLVQLCNLSTNVFKQDDKIETYKSEDNDVEEKANEHKK